MHLWFPNTSIGGFNFSAQLGPLRSGRITKKERPMFDNAPIRPGNAAENMAALSGSVADLQATTGKLSRTASRLSDLTAHQTRALNQPGPKSISAQASELAEMLRNPFAR